MPPTALTSAPSHPSLRTDDPIARAVLDIVLQHQRQIPGETCDHARRSQCVLPHQDQVSAAVRRGEPIRFVLPGFPGKSPNRAKVLGTLPDLGERLALRFLAGLCVQIREVYSPGARIVICSDGRVFSDVVGMADHDVSLYQDELRAMIMEEGLSEFLELYHLDHVLGASANADFTAARATFMARYPSMSVDELREQVKTDDAARRLYLGITRFLLEDASGPGHTGSRAARQRDARERAYAVIQRSNAWSSLLAERFRDAVRLSIHPQACGSEKLGIHLMGTADAWLTPWHGVVVDVGDRYVLRKRAEAEAAGAHLVEVAGRPSHYQLVGAERLGTAVRNEGKAQ